MRTKPASCIPNAKKQLLGKKWQWKKPQGRPLPRILGVITPISRIIASGYQFIRPFTGAMTIYDSIYNWQGTTMYQSEKGHDMPIKLSMNDIIKGFLVKKNINLTKYWRNHYTNPTKNWVKGWLRFKKLVKTNTHPSKKPKNYQPLDPPQKKPWKNEGFQPHGINPAPPGMYKTL